MLENTHVLDLVRHLVDRENDLPCDLLRQEPQLRDFDGLFDSPTIARLHNEALETPVVHLLLAVFQHSVRTDCSFRRQKVTLSTKQCQELLALNTTYLSNAVHNGLQALGDFRSRFEKDEAALGVSRQIAGVISSQLSDPHNGGNVVRALSQELVRWVYKPRSLSPESMLGHILDDMYELRLVDEVVRPRILDFGNYGWMEFLQHIPATTEAEVRYFYRRAGQMSAIAAFLGITDLHYENVLAHKAVPCILDAEGMFQPDFTHSDDTMRFSILRTGLLGLRQTGDEYGGDWSGFTFQRRPPLTTRLGVVHIDTGTLALFLQRHLTSPNHNYPLVVNLSPLQTIACFDELTEGFLDTRRKMKKLRLDLGSLLEAASERFKTFESRIFLRPTRAYMDARSRFLVCNSFSAAQIGAAVSEHTLAIKESEVKQLSQGDIPRFSVGLKERDLLDSSGALIARRFFLKSPWEAQLARLQRQSFFFRTSDNDVRSTLSSASGLRSHSAHFNIPRGTNL